MKTAQRYHNAPITEAIIDLRVKLADDFDFARLKNAGETVKSEYPTQSEVFEAIGQMNVHVGAASSASVEQNRVGYKSTSADEKQIFQSRINGFTYSRLAPYDRWESFQGDARRLWNIYRETVVPEQIVRLAVRYINRIDIPGASVDLEDYFRTSPEIAPELPQALEGFFMQLRLPCPEWSGSAVMNQTIVPPAREGVVSIVLDIDLFRIDSPPQDEKSIWDFFEDLHQQKNRFFEACITDEARKLFESCHP